MGMNKQAKDSLAQQQAATQMQMDAAKNIKPTAEAQGVNQAAYSDFNQVRNGDVSKLPFVAQYMQRAGAGRQRAMQTTLTGDASLASRIANPNLLASSREMMDRSAEQDQAGAVTGLAAQTEENAANRIMGFSGQSIGAANAQTQAYAGASNSAYQRYLQAKQEGTFWTKLGRGAMAGLGAFGALGGSLAGVPGLGGLFPGKSNG